METEEEMEEVFYLCRFDPEPAEAVTYYLPRLLPGSPPPPPPLPRGIDRLIHRADVYARSPADLAASFPPAPKAGFTGDRFFLTPCRRIPGRRGNKSARVVAGEGTWVIQKTREILDGAGGAKVGEVRNLSFSSKKGEATSGWVMEEYRCLLPQAAFDDGEMVLCKIHLSRNASAAARQESAAYLLHRQSQERAEPVSAHAAPNTKRAAPVAADLPVPSPKKTRLAAPLPVPVPVPAGASRFTCSPEELLGGGLAAQETPPVEGGKRVDEYAASLEGFLGRPEEVETAPLAGGDEPKQWLAASGSDEVSSSSMAAEDGELLGRCRNKPHPIIFPLSQLEGYNDFFSCA